MRFASFAEDGSVPVPALNLWFTATGPFRTSGMGAPQQPYATYGAGARVPMSSLGGGKYCLSTNARGAMDVVADDVFSTVSLASADRSVDIVSRLLEVKAIGASTTFLGANAFYGCWKLGPRFEPLYYGSGLMLGDGCFEGCSGIREFSPAFLAHVTGSGVAAFARCSSLRTIDGMSSFDPCAERSFYRCSSLATLRGGFSAARSFGERCFSGCSSLESLDGVPPTLDELGDFCFSECSSLSDITALGSTEVKSLPTGCFRGCGSLLSPDCGSGSPVTSFGDMCFMDCVSITSMSGAPARLRRIGDRCFVGTSVASLSGLPSSLEYVGAECFLGCDLLPSLDGLPDSVRDVGKRCFAESYGEEHPTEDPPEKPSTEWGLHDLSRLEDLIVRWQAPLIPEGCFEGDRMVHELPDLTELPRLSVGRYAFSGCSGLYTLAGLPPTVALEEGAFSDCYRAPHDWYILDDEHDPPQIVRKTRWCGLYEADMSGWDDTVTKLPPRCFQGCGALPELPPLPPKLTEMGDYCFAYCSGMKDLLSLADLDIHIDRASTYVDEDGNKVSPAYPKFGEWCFAGCGTQAADPRWMFFDGSVPVPDIGCLEDIDGLRMLCDRLEAEALSNMVSSGMFYVRDLIDFLVDATVSSAVAIVEKDIYDWYFVHNGWSSFLSEGDISLLAGILQVASGVSSVGFSVFYGDVARLGSVHAGSTYPVIAFVFPGEDPDTCELWVPCSGTGGEGTFDVPLTSARSIFQCSVSGEYQVAWFAVEVENWEVSQVSVQLADRTPGDEGGSSDPTFVSLSRDVREPAGGVTGAQARNFLAFMAYATVAMEERVHDGGEFVVGPGGLRAFHEYVISALPGPEASLSALYNLGLVEHAPMLSAHCFDGCTSLAPTRYPTLIDDVPPFCFANTAVSDLRPFGAVSSIRQGAFMNTALSSLEGFPSRVAEVRPQVFQGCTGLVSARAIPRGVLSFGMSAFSGCGALADFTCDRSDEWSAAGLSRSFLAVLRDELRRVSGEHSVEVHDDDDDEDEDEDETYPPLAAFTAARAVEKFGAACFMGDVSLTSAAFTAEFRPGDSYIAMARVREAIREPDIIVNTSSYAWSSAVDIIAVFHLSSDSNFIVRFTDDPSIRGPFLLDYFGNVNQLSEARAAGLSEARCDDSYYGEYADDLNVSVYSYDRGSRTAVTIRRLCARDGYAPSESGDPLAVVPARPRRGETGFVPVSISGDGYLRIVFEVEGRRFEAILSFEVKRVEEEGVVTSVDVKITGARVTDLEDPWPGYPQVGESRRYSAVPCLTTLGGRCFEGCVGLDTLDWVPFGVTSFPVRCFAGVPFTHSLQYTVDEPRFSGWTSPTVDAYRRAVARLRGLDRELVTVEIDDESAEPGWIRLYKAYGDEEVCIRLVVTYSEVDGRLVPSLAIDPSHTSTEAVDGNLDVTMDGYETPFGRTYGLAGALEAVSTSDNVATLRVGELTMDLVVTNVSQDPSSVSLDVGTEYVSCRSYDAMRHALSVLNGESVVTFADNEWVVAVSGSAFDSLKLTFDDETGTWDSEYGTPAAQVDLDPQAPWYVFRRRPGTSDEDRHAQESAGRFWFEGEVPGSTGDAADKPYRTVYVFAAVEARAVPVKSNSVVIPSWVDSIEEDCFTFDGFEDSEQRLEALYFDKSPEDVRRMSGYPWGVPSGCRIYSAMGGLVYQAP